MTTENRKPSRQYKNLTRQLPDLEDHIQQGKINVVPIPKGLKTPYITNWNNRVYSLTETLEYKTRAGKTRKQKGLKYHRGNYGILIGYGNKENGYSIACIDIDGYKTDESNPDTEIKSETQKLLYEILKDIPNSIQVKTQSGGYHIYLWTKKTQQDTSITSKSLYYPQDFPIKELRGKCLNDSIEVFTNQDKRQCILPSSSTPKGKYEVISEVNTFSDMDTVDDINQLVIDKLVSKGYGYKPVTTETSSSQTPSKSKKSRSKKSTKLKNLSDKEINTIVETVTPIFPVIDGAKHKGALELGGYFSYHITEESTSKIADGIINKIGDIFNNQQEFKKTLLENYTRNVNKSGLPKLCNRIQQRDSTFNISLFTETLNRICYPDYNKRVKRPIISKPYKLGKYIAASTKYQNNIYLSYIYQLKKYMLINEKDNDFYFTPLNTSYDPITLFNRSGNANWEEIEKEIKTILNRNGIKDLDNKVTDIIKIVLGNLKDLYINSHFTNLKNYPKPLKQYIQAPVTVYNLRTNDDETDNQEIAAVKEEIQSYIEGIITRYNNHSLYIKDSWINSQILHLANYTSKDPFLSLRLGDRPEKRYRAEAGELIVKELGLKRHLQATKERLFFYDTDLKYYTEVGTPELKKKLKDTLGYGLVETDITAITKAISTEDILHRNLIVFGNMYYDTNTMDEFKPLLEVSTYNRRDYLTVNNIGTYDKKTNTIGLLDYQKELQLEDIIQVKTIPELTQKELNKIPVEEYKTKYGMTLTEIVLRQILIPKDKPTDLRMFRDYLERLGSNIYGSNLYKVITFYYGDGDNAKSVLNLFNNLIFNRLDYEIKPDTLKDGFNLENFDNRLLITIDEVTRDSFTDLKDYLKQMSSKYSKMESRILYSSSTYTIYGFPNIYIYSNELLDLQPVEDGALFSRIDYLKLPNKFVEKTELNNYHNTYLKLDGLEELLSKDTDGLNWLITAGILCFKEMKATSNRYRLKQTKTETIEIFLGVDNLTNYLMVYTEYIDDLPRESFTSNTEILNGYLEYMDNLGKDIDKDGLSKEIGLKLNKLYPELKQEGNKYKQKGTGWKMYKLKLKSSEDITREYNQVYEINEYVTDKQLNILDENGNYHLVFRHIQDGNNTISILERKLPDKDCLEIVQELETLGLIIPTDQTRLNEPEEVNE